MNFRSYWNILFNISQFQVEKKKAAWEKSVGSIGSSSKLGLLVKKKPVGGGLVKTGGKELEASGKIEGGISASESSKVEVVQSKSAGPSGLGLLGAYSDSDNSSE